MADPYGTQMVRTDFKVPTDQFFLYYMAMRKWQTFEFRSDLMSQLQFRTQNYNLSSDLASRVMDEFYKNAKISKLLAKAKEGVKSVKSFELTPQVIADFATSILTGLFTITQAEMDRGNDRNRNDFLSDGYIRMMLYTYAFVGRVQPHARPGSDAEELKGSIGRGTFDPFGWGSTR